MVQELFSTYLIEDGEGQGQLVRDFNLVDHLVGVDGWLSPPGDTLVA